MSHDKSSWAMPFSLLLAGLSACFAWEWRHARADTRRHSEALREALSSAQRALEPRLGQVEHLLSSIRAEQMNLRRAVDRGLSALREPAPLLGSQLSETQTADAPGEAEPGLQEAAPYPELPPDAHAPTVLKGTVREFERDPRFNPTGRTLSQVELLKVDAALTWGRAVNEALERETAATMREAMETLRSAGDYRDYATGEAYDEPIPGVITAAESLAAPARGVRMFAFHPEEYPQLYVLQERKKNETNLAVRKALSVIAGGDRHK